MALLGFAFLNKFLVCMHKICRPVLKLDLILVKLSFIRKDSFLCVFFKLFGIISEYYIDAQNLLLTF